MKTASLALSATFLSAACLLGSGASQAASLSFLNNTIAARIPAKDLPAFKSAIGVVLDQAADHSTSQWTSSSRGSRQPVQVSLTPQLSAQTQSAGICRLLDASVSQSGRSEQWQFWFCKGQDGAWKASGSDQPR